MELLQVENLPNLKPGVLAKIIACYVIVTVSNDLNWIHYSYQANDEPNHPKIEDHLDLQDD